MTPTNTSPRVKDRINANKQQVLSELNKQTAYHINLIKKDIDILKKEVKNIKNTLIQLQKRIRNVKD